MPYHRIVSAILNLLRKNNFWLETFEHEPVTTSQQAAKVRTGYSLAQGAKAIIVKAKDKFVMLVLPGDKKFNGSKVKKLLHVKDIRFATEEEMKRLTDGIEIGGVPPFGNLFDIPMIVDKTLFDNEKIIFNAGDRRFSIAMKSEDYKKIVDGLTVASIV